MLPRSLVEAERIPGFAICARCGFRGGLAPCRACGLLMCADCRDPVRCAACFHERRALAWRTRRRGTLKRGVAISAGVISSGLLALGAVLRPAPTTSPLRSPVLAAFAVPPSLLARLQLEHVARAVTRHARSLGGVCPPSLEAVARAGGLPWIEDDVPVERGVPAAPVSPWGGPVSYTCAPVSGGFELRVAGPDGLIGSDDDVVVRGWAFAAD